MKLSSYRQGRAKLGVFVAPLQFYGQVGGGFVLPQDHE